MNNSKLQYRELVRKVLSGKVLCNDRDMIECRSKIVEKIKSIRETRKRKKRFLDRITRISDENARKILHVLEQKRKRHPKKIPPLKNVPQGPYSHLGPDTRRKLLPVLKKKGLLKLKPRNGPYVSFFRFYLFLSSSSHTRIHLQGVPFTKTSIDSTQFASLVNNGITNEIRSKAMDDWTWRPPSAEFQEEGGFPLKFSHMTKFYEKCGTDPWISDMRKQLYN